VPSGSLARAEKVTVKGATPLVVSAEIVQLGGWPVTLFFRNQGVVVGLVLKKASKWLATLKTPLLDGCVKSSRTSSQFQTKPSERGLVPSAQRYGPHATHGATTVPWAESKFRLLRPRIWSSITHLSANAVSNANGSGLRALGTSV